MFRRGVGSCLPPILFKMVMDEIRNVTGQESGLPNMMVYADD
jgi:hypothetical protein